MDENVRQDIENEILSGSWDLIRRRLNSNTAKHFFRAADLDVDGGYNFFHVLCRKSDAPLDIIEKMIDTDEAFLTKTSKNGEGYTALHLAAQTGSATTIKLLLDRMCKVAPWDASTRDENHLWVDECSLTPLDMLWKSQLDPEYEMWNGENKNPQSTVELIKKMDKITRYSDMTTEMQDLWEKTTYFVHAALTGSTQGHTLPRGEQWFIIHEIVKRGGREEMYFPKEVLWFATKLYPDLLRVRNEKNDLPIHLALKSCLLWNWSVLAESGNLATLAKKDKDLRSILDSFADRTIVSVLLRGFPEAASTKDGSGRLPLQIFCDNLLVENSTDLKYVDVEALLKAAPEAPLSIDKKGNTPLHCLCKLLCRRQTKYIGKLIRNTILKIVELNPQAAGVRDHSGRLPLNILLLNGGPAHDAFGIWTKEDVLALVEKVIDSAPDALDVPNAGTRLLPFMAAATGENSFIDCAYTLLHRNPVNVRGGIIKTDYELYLERKVDDLSSRVKSLSSRVKSLEDEFVSPKASVKKRKL